MGREYRLFPKASLVQAPPKGLCYHSKSVLRPCPPHRIAPLWERDFLSRAEGTTRLNNQPGSTQSPFHPYSRPKSAALQWPKHLATNSVSLLYLKYQSSIKPSLYPLHTDPYIMSLPNHKFRESTNVVLGTLSKCIIPLLRPKHKAETPVVLKILEAWHCQGEELPHLREKPSTLPFPEWSHLKQQPPHLQFNPHHQVKELSQHRQKHPASPPIFDYQLEVASLMNHKTRSTFHDPQARTRPDPMSSSHLEEATQKHKGQVRIVTFVLSGGRTNFWPKYLILQSSCKDHHSKRVLGKVSNLDYFINKASKYPDLDFRENPLPFLNQKSGTWTSPSPLPKYVNQTPSTQGSWSQFNIIFTSLSSLDPNHQARATMTQSQGFFSRARKAFDTSLSLGIWEISEISKPFQCPELATDTTPDSDYKVKVTTGPPPPPQSTHKVKIPPPRIDHFNDVALDLSHQITILIGPEQRTSSSIVLSSGSAVASSSKTQDVFPLFPPINQTEFLSYPRILGKDSLTLEYKSKDQVGIGQQVEASEDPDNQVTSSLCPEQQTQTIWGSDCKILVSLNPENHEQFLNISDYHRKESMTPDTQTHHELVSSQYQTQIVPDSDEIISPLNDKTKIIPPLSHEHTTKSESEAKKVTQLASLPKHIPYQLCPDYWMVSPEIAADHLRETKLDTSAQVTSYQIEADFWKTKPWILDYQTTTPLCQDDGAASSQSIDQKSITPSRQENSQKSSLGIDHQVMPLEQNDNETPSLGKTHQAITSLMQDIGEITSLDIEHKFITPPWQDNIDHQLITPSWQDDNETPSLSIDYQLITPPGQDNSDTLSLGIELQTIMPPMQDGGETPSLGIEHKLLISSRQDVSEIPSWDIDCQVTIQSSQYDSDTLSLGIDHQTIMPPVHDAGDTSSLEIDHQVSTPLGQNSNETSSLEIDLKLITSPWQNDSETSSLGIDHQHKMPLVKIPWHIDYKGITPPEQGDNKIPSLSMVHQVTTLPRQDGSEIPSLAIDHQFIIPPEQDNIDHQDIVPLRQDDSEMTTLNIDCQVIPPWHCDSSKASSLGIDCQVKTPPWQEDIEASSLGKDHQVTIPPCQDNGAVPSQCLGHEVTALSDFDHVNIDTPSPELKLGVILDLNDQVTPLHDLDHETNMSVRTELQNTSSTGHSNQAGIGPGTNSNQSTFPTGKDNQNGIPFFTPSHQKDTPTGHGHHQTPLTPDDRDKVQYRLQYQTVKKEIPWHLKYIEPYTIEGRANVSTRTIQTIINSVPEEKIIGDLCKQILFRRMKEIPCLKPGECMSTSYSVCLKCASWVPNGCLHDKEMTHLFEAEMLAIPMPLPDSEEEIGLRFVLRIPYRPFSFSQLFPEFNVQWPSYYLPYAPSFSHKHTVSHASAKARWLDYSEIDYHPWKIKKAKKLSLTKNLSKRSESNEKQKSRGHRKGFKFLREKFQRQN